MSNIINVDNLSLELDGKSIFSNISFSVEEGKTLGILCPNNGGKTTLIKTLSGIMYSSSGKVDVNNVILSKKNYRDYIIQISTILDDIDNQFLCNKVSEELRYPLENLGYGDLDIKYTIDEISNLFDINILLGKNINRLTNLEKVQVLIVASIIHKPKVLFLDDILRFFNNSEKDKILKIFNIINSQLNISIIYTTSDLNDLINNDNILVINDGQIVMTGTFADIIQKDNELTKMGFDIPIMIDLSRKLEFYKLVDKIYLNPDKLVDDLWE